MSKNKADWNNRIVGYDNKPASWFLANEANWRIHPKNQQESLGGILDGNEDILKGLDTAFDNFIVDFTFRASSTRKMCG